MGDMDVRFPIPLAIGKTSKTKNLTRMGDKGDRDEGHVKVGIRHPDRHSSLGPSLLDMLLLSFNLILHFVVILHLVCNFTLGVKFYTKSECIFMTQNACV